MNNIKHVILSFKDANGIIRIHKETNPHLILAILNKKQDFIKVKVVKK